MGQHTGMNPTASEPESNLMTKMSFRTTALLIIVFGVSLEALALPPPAPAGTLFRKKGDTAIYLSVWNYKRLIANPAVLSGCGLASTPVANNDNAVALMPIGREINTLADCLNAVVDANRPPRASCEQTLFDSGALAEAYNLYGTLDNKKGQGQKAKVKADITTLTSQVKQDKTACDASPAQDKLSALIANSQPPGPSSPASICQSSCSSIARTWNGNWSCDPSNVTAAGGIYGQNCVCNCS